MCCSVWQWYERYGMEDVWHAGVLPPHQQQPLDWRCCDFRTTTNHVSVTCVVLHAHMPCIAYPDMLPFSGGLTVFVIDVWILFTLRTTLFSWTTWNSQSGPLPGQSHWPLLHVHADQPDISCQFDMGNACLQTIAGWISIWRPLQQNQHGAAQRTPSAQHKWLWCNVMRRSGLHEVHYAYMYTWSPSCTVLVCIGNMKHVHKLWRCCVYCQFGVCSYKRRSVRLLKWPNSATCHQAGERPLCTAGTRSNVDVCTVLCDGQSADEHMLRRIALTHACVVQGLHKNTGAFLLMWYIYVQRASINTYICAYEYI